MAAALIAIASAAAGGGATAPQPPIVINAAFSRVDYTDNTVIFRNIVVSQGDMRLTAGRAHAMGVGFGSSEWTFEDGVTVELEPRGTLHCERAIVIFRDNRISAATATGAPAQFEQRHAGFAEAAHGRADRIVYDARDDSVQLIGNARFSDPRGLEVSGGVLRYLMRNEQLQAASPGEKRGVHITVTPPASSQEREPAARGRPRR